MPAKGLGEDREIGVLELRGDDPSRKLALLVHADRAVHAVVEHDHDDRAVILHGRRQLLAVHHEVAVAREGDRDPVGCCRFAMTAAGTP